MVALDVASPLGTVSANLGHDGLNAGATLLDGLIGGSVSVGSKGAKITGSVKVGAPPNSNPFKSTSSPTRTISSKETSSSTSSRKETTISTHSLIGNPNSSQHTTEKSTSSSHTTPTSTNGHHTSASTSPFHPQGPSSRSSRSTSSTGHSTTSHTKGGNPFNPLRPQPTETRSGGQEPPHTTSVNQPPFGGQPGQQQPHNGQTSSQKPTTSIISHPNPTNGGGGKGEPDPGPNTSKFPPGGQPNDGGSTAHEGSKPVGGHTSSTNPSGNQATSNSKPPITHPLPLPPITKEEGPSSSKPTIQNPPSKPNSHPTPVPPSPSPDTGGPGRNSSPNSSPTSTKHPEPTGSPRHTPSLQTTDADTSSLVSANFFPTTRIDPGSLLTLFSLSSTPSNSVTLPPDASIRIHDPSSQGNGTSKDVIPLGTVNPTSSLSSHPSGSNPTTINSIPPLPNSESPLGLPVSAPTQSSNETPQSSRHLHPSGGEIAAIILAILAFVLILVGLLFYSRRRRRRLHPAPSSILRGQPRSMSSLGHLSASPFATSKGDSIPRDLYPSNTIPNSPGEQSALAAGIESSYRDSDSDSPPPSASSSRDAQSMRSSRAFSTSTHQSHRATNNPYVVPQQPPTPYSDSRITLNPYANAQRSLNPYLNAEPQTNPFADTHLFIDPQEEKVSVQQVNSEQLWVEEPDISHVLAYLQRGSSATPVQNSTDDGHQSKNRLSEGSSTMEIPSSPPLAEAIAM